MDSNLKQYYRELAEKVESGEYFNEAREFYFKKYENYFIERSYIIIIIISLLILFAFAIGYYRAILPIRKSLPVKVAISSVADFSTRITYLGNKEKKFDINEVFIKYFSGRFVEAIESYDYKDNFKKLRVNKNMIETLASNDIVTYYLDKISIRNPDSLILKYKKKTARKIIIDQSKTELAPYKQSTDISSSFSDEENNEKQNIKKYVTTVNFQAIEMDDSGAVTKSNWQAKIILSFQTIIYNYDTRDFSPLNFKVVNYESKRIN